MIASTCLLAGLGLALAVASAGAQQPAATQPPSLAPAQPAPQPSTEAIAPPAPAPPGLAAMRGLPAYPEAKRAALAVAGKFVADDKTERPVRMCKDAALAFQRLRAAAASEGVRILPISGFRGVVHQQLLFERAVARYQSQEEAARWVAPPGYSEHHTGLALDLGDEDARGTLMAKSFAATGAYRWLKRRAAEFGWEESFPAGNPGGFHPEPWHWRYVGSEPGRPLRACGHETGAAPAAQIAAPAPHRAVPPPALGAVPATPAATAPESAPAAGARP
jgi:LAS superfamily LD-carboxypeptidase LdcB